MIAEVYQLPSRAVSFLSHVQGYLIHQQATQLAIVSAAYRVPGPSLSGKDSMSSDEEAMSLNKWPMSLDNESVSLDIRSMSLNKGSTSLDKESMSLNKESM
jgi:hypothetical protein